MTVETDSEYAVYKLHPLYEFGDTSTCEDFMSRVRERVLLASFLPYKIYKSSTPNARAKQSILRLLIRRGTRDVLLARCKVVRLWERDTGSTNGPSITMTFHDRSKNPPMFTEWSLRDFRDTAILLQNSRLVELSRHRRAEQFIFVFAGKNRLSSH